MAWLKLKIEVSTAVPFEYTAVQAYEISLQGLYEKLENELVHVGKVVELHAITPVVMSVIVELEGVSEFSRQLR